MKSKSILATAVLLWPVLFGLFVWLSPLAFVPVPWPDDSAFYFVAHELFRWPPRWVMLPQAPFEPTYRIFNFNTMPLYPILIGLGRFIGIDGSFALKIWPLAGWVLSVVLAGWVLFRKKLHPLGVFLVVLCLSMDPALRWASVLIRPESIIGLCGMALVLGLTFGFPDRFKPRKFWDPVAALLALAAYCHFNAIHLLFPVIFFYAATSTRESALRLVSIGAKTALYLSPWILAVILHWQLFWHQMATQWKRLAVPNHWLSSVSSALRGMFQDMGSPVAFPSYLTWASVVLWLAVFLALACLIRGLFSAWFGGTTIPPLFASSSARGELQPAKAERRAEKPKEKSKRKFEAELTLIPAAAWVIGAFWLWHTKPEVWFTYYLHLASWTFLGILLLRLQQSWDQKRPQWQSHLLGALLGFSACVFAAVNLSQFQALAKEQSWSWSTYREFVDCVDQRLSRLEQERKNPEKPLQAWFPTFPDVTIELSRRHPSWQFTRTNDFHERIPLAYEHSREVDAVVVTETIQGIERNLSGPMQDYPDITSLWMTWDGYFLKGIGEQKDWMPVRHLCQKGRWMAFMYMKPGASTGKR